jgi:hypothetical protein
VGQPRDVCRPHDVRPINDISGQIGHRSIAAYTDTARRHSRRVHEIGGTADTLPGTRHQLDSETHTRAGSELRRDDEVCIDGDRNSCMMHEVIAGLEEVTAQAMALAVGPLMDSESAIGPCPMRRSRVSRRRWSVDRRVQ